jgi:hypothetical protein
LRVRREKMKHGKMTREQAIETVGAELVSKLDSVNCEPTGRLQCDGDDTTEYTASIKTADGGTLIAYYYTTPEQEQAISDADGDGSAIDWEIHGYEIV